MTARLQAPLLLRWVHAANNSFSIIQFTARHKKDSKDNAAANEHGRCCCCRCWLRRRLSVCQRKGRIFIFYACLTFPLRRGNEHSRACCENVRQHRRVKETDGGGRVSCGSAVQRVTSEEILSAPSQARLRLLIACSRAKRARQCPAPGTPAKSSSRQKAVGLESTRWTHKHAARNEPASYLFIRASLSITAIIRANSFKFGENEGSIRSQFSIWKWRLRP